MPSAAPRDEAVRPRPPGGAGRRITCSIRGGGEFLAVLINPPGAAATTFDGYPTARAGRSNEALGLWIATSVIGGTISYLALPAFIEPMARFALLFGSGDVLFLTVFVILAIATLQRKSFTWTIFAGLLGLLGLLLSTVGTSVTTGMARGTMGLGAFENGLPIILYVIGLFALPEPIAIVARPAISKTAQAPDLRRMLGGVRRGVANVRTWARGSMIGTLVGLLPAAGTTVASLLSYAAASRRATGAERFGEGEPRGVVAAESANNALEGGAMAVLMALGVPGSASTAVISGAFLLHGLVPQPRLFVDDGPLVYGLILGNLVQMALLGVFAVLVASQMVRIVTAPWRRSWRWCSHSEPTRSAGSGRTSSSPSPSASWATSCGAITSH